MIPPTPPPPLTARRAATCLNQAKLVPSKEECYPTPRYKAACFFSKYQKDVETRRISTGGPDEVEWLLLLAETRQAAAEGREKQRQQQELRAKTERGAARQGNSRPDLQDDKKAVQAGGKHGEGRGGECVAGSVVSEAGTVPEPGPSGWSRFSRSPVGSKHERKGLFKAAKTFWRWAQRLYRVPWTPHRAGGVDSSFDWVTEVPASARHDVV